MGNISSRGAMAHVIEALEWEWADGSFFADPDSMIEYANEKLCEYLDTSLIYFSDIAALWDGGTHELVYVESVETLDLSDLVRQSVYFQLSDEWNWITYDAVDDFLAQKYSEAGLGSVEGLDREDLFEALT